MAFQDIYYWISGPLVWAAFAVFAGGVLFRIVWLIIMSKRRDKVVLEYFSCRYALRSIMHWMIPFGTQSMKQNPITTLISFVFHLTAILLPVFLAAHIILVKESWNVSWVYLPDVLADLLTLVVILCCIYFALRRMLLPEIKYLSSWPDFMLLVIVAAPFITGFWASMQWIGYPYAAIVHMLTGELLLVCIPFTRLSHMFFFPFARGYIGSEFGAVRHAKDW